MFQKFQTTNQASLDWLKEFPKKYIPFLDFPLGNSQIIGSANPQKSRRIREVFEVFEGCTAASELSQKSAKNAYTVCINQYYTIIYIYIIYNYIHQTQDLRSALCLNLRFTNKQYRIGSTCRPPRTKDSPRDSL